MQRFGKEAGTKKPPLGLRSAAAFTHYVPRGCRSAIECTVPADS